MELLYVWIEDYKNIKNQGFNFSPKHWFYYDKKNKQLKHEEKNSNYPNNFFGENISNVTAIVGKNGSGKSNIIQIISKLTSGQLFSSKLIFAIWSHRGKSEIKYYATSLIKCNLELNLRNLPSNKFHIYYTGILQYLSLGSNSINLSTISKLADISIFPRDDIQSNRFRKTPFKFIFNEYQFREVTQQIRFIDNASKILQDSLKDKLYIPSSLEIRLHRRYRNYYRKVDDFAIANKKLTSQIICGFYITIVENLLKHISSEEDKIVSKDIIDSYSDEDGAANSLKKFSRKFSLKTRSNKTYTDSINSLEKISNLIKSNKYGIGSSFVNESKKETKQIDKFFIGIKKESTGKDILKFLNELKISLGNLQNLVSFQWEGLSYGEYEVLKLGSSLYTELQNKTKGEYKNVLLNIDEGELGFHAEWQRKYLPLLLNLLTKLFPNISFQIILTTHSPFLVSDLPKDNIIFLNKKENGDCLVSKPEDMTHTFGANIHSLYRNSFFLENGLMGEFAKGKIDAVIRDLNQANVKEIISEERKNEIKFIIEQIGEPLLKEKLIRKFKETLEPIQDRINELKLEIEKLEASQKQ